MTAYGMAKWPDRLARIPQAHEGATIARVQSMRTRGVTVPQPLNASPRRDSATTPPPEVAAVRAGANQETKA